MSKNFRRSKIIFALLLSATFQLIISNIPTRDYPINKDFGSDFYEHLSFSTQSFSSNTEAIIDESFGMRVLNPWKEYELKAVAESLTKYRKAVGKPTKDYFRNLVFNQFNHKLPMEMVVDRDIVGQEFQFNFAYQNLFDTVNCDWAGKKADLNKSILKNIDFVCNVETAFISANSKATYDVGVPLENTINEMVRDPRDAVDLADKNLINLDRNVFFQAIENARQNIQADMDFDTHFSKQKGFTDINVTLGLRKRMVDVCRCKRIDLFSGLVISLPTGQKADPNNILSFNFGQQATTVNLLMSADILLKHDFAVGIATLINFGYDSIEKRRVAIGDETSIFSPFMSKVKIENGSTVSVSPYFKCKDLFMENLDLRIAYTYTSHGPDRMYNMEPAPLFESKEIRGVSNRQSKDSLWLAEKYTTWATRIFEFRFDYRFNGTSSDLAVSHPTNIFLSYQLPFNGYNTLSHKKVTVGFNINF